MKKEGTIIKISKHENAKTLCPWYKWISALFLDNQVYLILIKNNQFKRKFVKVYPF